MRKQAILLLFAVSYAFDIDIQSDMSQVCPHQYWATVSSPMTLNEGVPVYRNILANQTHLYYYENENVTVMNQADLFKKLLIRLEPCKGVVYLFVRKTWPCWPNPYSCINLSNGARSASCDSTYIRSVIDGSRDGTPTYFETNFTSTRWFISVFASQDASYTLTALADIGAMPRPGLYGNLTGYQTGEQSVQLKWGAASFLPVGVSEVQTYWVYSSLLLPSEQRLNPLVFVNPSKILNTVCGLHNSTDSAYMAVAPSSCSGGICTANITGVLTDKRYVFNIVAHSKRGFNAAYSGVIIHTGWTAANTAINSKTLAIFGALGGTIIGVFVISYIWLLRIYN